MLDICSVNLIVAETSYFIFFIAVYLKRVLSTSLLRLSPDLKSLLSNIFCNNCTFKPMYVFVIKHLNYWSRSCPTCHRILKIYLNEFPIILFNPEIPFVINPCYFLCSERVNLIRLALGSRYMCIFRNYMSLQYNTMCSNLLFKIANSHFVCLAKYTSLRYCVINDLLELYG